jgi:protein SCO1/2
MRSKIWANVMAISALLVAAVAVLLTQPAVADNSRWGSNYFPNVELINQDGQKVHFYDDVLKGKIVVIDLIYTHCVDACPLETARLVQVQKMLGDRVGKDVFFYSITIDPKRDTPEVLKAYMDKFHVGPGWTFLTGKKADIDLISKKMGLYSEPDPNDRDGHTPSILLGNEATGQWLRNTATDNPRFMATMIGDWMNSWANAKNQAPRPSYDKVGAFTQEEHDGRYLFAKHCAACHTIGHGDKIGPDLKDISSARDQAWLYKLIQTPDKMITEKDPLALQLFEKYKQVNMPNLRLSDEETKAILKFLKDPTAAPVPHEPAHDAGDKSGAAKVEPAAAHP